MEIGPAYRGVGIPRKRFLCLLFASAVLLAVPASAQVTPNVTQFTLAGNVKVHYLYKLSNFAGVIPYGWVKVITENRENEIYVLTGSSVSIFSKSGMETYRFGYDPAYGNIYDASFNPDGTMLLLSYEGFKFWITRCNFRGEPIERIEPKNLPPEFSDILPNRVILQNNRLYLAEYGKMRVVVMEPDGTYADGYDLTKILQFPEDKLADTGMHNFNLDREGNFLFTMPVVASAFIVSPDRTVRSFGKRGSAPGRLGIPVDMLRDGKGNYLVVDALKSAVLVFDKDFNFLMEFGYRGKDPSNLISPKIMALDGEGRLYVVQAAKRGVNVYQLTYE